MAFVTLQVGQCGNQLGPHFFDVIASEYASPSGVFYDQLPWNPFFRMPNAERGERGSRPIARSVLIDMEPAVVQSTLLDSQRRNSPWTYSRSRCCIGHSGSGNNWAMGYALHGPGVKKKVMELIRHEMEEADVFGGFLVMQSTAGGTGSGLGTFVTETIGDAFPKAHLLNYCIAPFRLGEVIVQSYNTLLTLSHLLHSSHAIFLTENDALSEICQKEYCIKRPSFDDMNQRAMEALAGSLLPSKMRSVMGQDSFKGTSGSWCRIVSDFLSVMSPHRHQKLLTCHSLPRIRPNSRDYGHDSWSQLMSRAKKVMQSGKQKMAGGHCISNFLTLRGKEAHAVDVQLLADDGLYVHQVARVGVAHSPAPFRGHEKSLSLVHHSRRNAVPLREALLRARQMFKSKAFLHQYECHGIHQADFKHTLHFIEDVLIDHYQLHLN